MLKFIFLFLCFLLFSCQDAPPYEEFEAKLINQVCECVLLEKNKTEESDFLEKYEDCTEKSSQLLAQGLNEYPEDPRISKEAYLEKLPDLVKDLLMNNKCE